MQNKGFLRNAWYVAAWGHEVAGAPFSRTILGEPVVLYRMGDGTAVALEDRCPHRRLALSRGRVIGDDIECGYHGFTLNAAGRCVRIPGQGTIPDTARVRSYPIVERWRWLWIWMGEPEQADPGSIPDIWMNDHPDWAVSEGPLIHVDGHYQLVIDNLLDGSHVSFVHKSTLGTDDVADIPVQAHVDGDSVRMTRWILDRPAAPLYADLGGFDDNVDRWQIITSTPPSLVVVDMGSAEAGSGAPDGDRSRGVELRSFNLLTPETEKSCFYFYSHVRNFALDDPRVTDKVRDLFRVAFLEDKDVIEAVQHGNDRFPDAPRTDAAFDKAPLMARRVLDRAIARERQATAASAAQ